MASRKQLDEEIKTRYLSNIWEHLENCGEEVLQVKSNEIAIPVLDEESNERFLVLTFKVPTGERNGDEYDGYSMAEDYTMKQEKKKEKAEEKKKKAEADKAKREKARAEKERAKAEKEKAE